MQKKRRKTDFYHEQREAVKLNNILHQEQESWQKIEKIRSILNNDSLLVEELKLFLSPDELNNFCNRVISNYDNSY